MYQKNYKDMNERIVPDRSLNERVLERAVPRKGRHFRPAAVAAALLIIALAATPVMAECVPWVLERIAPELTRRLQPVQRSDTNNGITLEVVGASVKGFEANLVVKIEGETLKEPVGVAPCITTNRDGLMSGSLRSITDYEGAQEDKNNGIYYYEVCMTYRKDISLEELLQNQITVMLDEIQTSIPDAEETEIPLILTDEEEIKVTAVKELEKRGYNTGWRDSQEYPHGCALGAYVMQFSGKSAYDITEDLSLMGASYIDGMLHVQLRARNTSDKFGNPIWGYFGPWLTDKEGNQVKSVYHNSFSTSPGLMRVEYVEYIFDIPQEELENYTLTARLEKCGTVQADCKVTFRFTEDEISAE